MGSKQQQKKVEAKPAVEKKAHRKKLSATRRNEIQAKQVRSKMDREYYERKDQERRTQQATYFAKVESECDLLIQQIQEKGFLKGMCVRLQKGHDLHTDEERIARLKMLNPVTLKKILESQVRFFIGEKVEAVQPAEPVVRLMTQRDSETVESLARRIQNGGCTLAIYDGFTTIEERVEEKDKDGKATGHFSIRKRKVRRFRHERQITRGALILVLGSHARRVKGWIWGAGIDAPSLAAWGLDSLSNDQLIHFATQFFDGKAKKVAEPPKVIEPVEEKQYDGVTGFDFLFILDEKKPGDYGYEQKRA